MISARFKVAVLVGAGLGAVLVGGFTPLVRYEAARIGERYGADVVVGRVVPTLHGARLRDVVVTFGDIPSGHVHLDEIEVSYGSGGRTVSLRGGMISAVGRREVLVREVETWRSHRPSPPAAGGGGAGGKIEMADFALSWKNDESAPSEAVAASGLRFQRDGDKVGVSAVEASLVLGRTAVSAKNGRVELTRRDGGGYGIAELAADGLDAQLAFPAPSQNPKDDAPGVTAVADGKPASRGRTVRSALLRGVLGLDALLEPAGRIRIGGVLAHVRRGDDAMTFGPGRLEVGRSDDHRLVIELAPEMHPDGPSPAAPASKAPELALTFRLSAPLRDAAPTDQEIVAAVRGGPIWLSTLGVKEGEFGLFDVGRTSITTRSEIRLSADGESVRVDGDAHVRGLSLRSAALSDEPVAGLELALRVKGELRLDGSRFHVDDGEVDLGAAHLVGKGDYELVNGASRVQATFEVPLTACQSMLDSVPKGLVPKLRGMAMAGSFGLKGKTSFDTANLDRSYQMAWDVANTCRVTDVPPEIAVERFRAPFQRTVYDPEGKQVAVEAGPGTPGWCPFSAVSKFMETAVLTTEDAAFHRHHGFDQEAIRNSIRENLRKRRFVRGASTISMQLAKNIYLDRTKNLSRKLQEAVLTMYLEQELTKEQILELYFNVVEFCPMLYGIGPAARHYFSTSAAELSLGQSLYIASILPNPKVQHFAPTGEVTPSWTTYLQKLMKLAHDHHRLTDDELDDGLREALARGVPAPRRESAPDGGAPLGEGEGDAPADGDATPLPPEPNDAR